MTRGAQIRHTRRSTRCLHVTDVDMRLLTARAIPPGPIDVRFDGRRTWTFTPDRRRGVIHALWPAGLAERLSGRAELSIASTRDGAVLAQADVMFGGTDIPLVLTDGDGRRLVVNKWGELSTEFASSDPALTDQILELAQNIVGVLEQAGHTVMITSGTLLGWVRDRALLPNDDDADLALLVTSSESPADIAIVGMAARRLLTAAGYSVTLHSAVHLQVRLGGDGPDAASYCDVFLGFFRDQVYCQPFHLRSVVPRPSLYPVKIVELSGRRLPAPPVPEDWLAACYGPTWQTPDPGFTFQTPSSTRSRYENWFGSFNFGRAFWDARWRADRERPLSRVHTRAVGDAANRVGAAMVVDAGCGSGRWTEQIAGTRAIRAFDYSVEALARARRRLPSDARIANINLADGRDVLEEEIAVTAHGPVVLSFHDLLHTLTIDTRANALRLARAALRVGGAVVATFPVELDPSRYTFRDPTSWHLPVEQLADEAAAHGLHIASSEINGEHPDSRSWITVELAVRPRRASLETQRNDPMRRALNALASRVRRITPHRRNDQLAAEIAELRSDLNELRRDNLRIAQLHDIVVERLAHFEAPAADATPPRTPGAKQ